MGLFSIFKKKEKDRPVVVAVIAAGGSSARMEGEDKLFLELSGVPVIARTLMAFEACRDIDGIVVSAACDRIIDVQDIAKEFQISKLLSIVSGGEDRTRSVLAGLIEAKNADFAAIHDGARPLVTPELISRAVALGVETGAAVPALPVADTLKRCENGVVISTVSRAGLFHIQTPQVFQAGLIKGALTRAIDEKRMFTDDAAAMEDMGFRIHTVPGDPKNLKITVPDDIFIAEGILLGEE